MIRHLALLALATTLVPSAHASGYLTAEVASYDLDVGDSNHSGTLYGVSAGFRKSGPLMLAIQGHALTGDVEYEFNNKRGITDTTKLKLGEVRGLIGSNFIGSWVGYTGVGYRYVKGDIPNGSPLTSQTTYIIPNDLTRTSQTIYIPFGLASSGQIFDSTWRWRTEVEAGLVVWGEEDMEGTVAGTDFDQDFTRTSGGQARLSITFQKGALTLGPFVRAFQLDKTEEEAIDGRHYSVDVDTTEAGFRIGYGF